MLDIIESSLLDFAAACGVRPAAKIVGEHSSNLMRRLSRERVTVHEAAARLRVSRKTIYRMIRNGRIKPQRKNQGSPRGQWLIPLAELDRASNNQ